MTGVGGLLMMLTKDNFVGVSVLRRGRWVFGLATVICCALLLADPGHSVAQGTAVDLAIGVTADPAGTFASPVTLTLTVINNGPDTLQGAVAGTRPLLDDQPPFNLRPPAGCTTDPPPLWTIKCPVRPMPAGTSTQIPIQAYGAGGGTFDPVPITFILSSITPSDLHPHNNSTTINCVFLGFGARC